MSTGARIPLAEAQGIAGELVTLLGVGAERIAVAGSIRRKRPDVGDIELVAIPRKHIETVPGLLEDERREVDDLALQVDTLLIQGSLFPHPTDPKRGDRYAKLIHAESGLQLDLFMARRQTWGIILLIRTGSAKYSLRFVMTARARGHHVAGGELHVGAIGCGSSPCTVVPTPEERDVYRALDVPYVPPEQRS